MEFGVEVNRTFFPLILYTKKMQNDSVIVSYVDQNIMSNYYT